MSPVAEKDIDVPEIMDFIREKILVVDGVDNVFTSLKDRPSLKELLEDFGAKFEKQDIIRAHVITPGPLVERRMTTGRTGFSKATIDFFITGFISYIPTKSMDRVMYKDFANIREALRQVRRHPAAPCVWNTALMSLGVLTVAIVTEKRAFTQTLTVTFEKEYRPTP